MRISDIMSRNPVTVFPDTPLTEAQALMKKNKVHRLPVIDRQYRVQGIVSIRDLLRLSPSDASTLDMYEMTALLTRLQVHSAMTRQVICVQADELVEEAARLMVDNDIGGIPVVNSQKELMGIVTESDLFRLFITMFGARRPGWRVSFELEQKKGELAEISREIAQRNGNIITFLSAPGSNPSRVNCLMKVDSISHEALIEALQPHAITILDIRKT
jgi:acetoin utilization protein AcuB